MDNLVLIVPFSVNPLPIVPFSSRGRYSLSHSTSLLRLLHRRPPPRLDSSASLTSHTRPLQISRLNWTTVEALMCARSWLWAAENNGARVAEDFATVLNEMESDDEAELVESSSGYHFED
ncbi:hypothetical protein P8452_32133 [Trifolium repens]|nr:hypothetical protein P8452_32133 [Trifolium repens]